MSRSLSGRQLVKVLHRIGFVVDHQHGSHVFLHNLERNVSVIVPDHKELKKGTLHFILKKSGLDFADLLKLA